MERKIPAAMMKHITWIAIVSITLFACSSSRKGRTGNEKIPEIAGTWYENGNKELPCYIVQNGRDIVFLSGKETSGGFFKNSAEVFAKEWNRNAYLSSNSKTLRWADRTWKKGEFSYPNIAGTWYENGEASKQIIITQKKNKLVMDNGTQKLNGYFYTTNGIYSVENNNYGTYTSSNSTITWGGKAWVRNVKR
jgi:hypothetical protein